MELGKGYIIRDLKIIQRNWIPTYEASFIGVPNNGRIESPIGIKLVLIWLETRTLRP
jgi:hypothetical protein